MKLQSICFLFEADYLFLSSKMYNYSDRRNPKSIKHILTDIKIQTNSFLKHHFHYNLIKLVLYKSFGPKLFQKWYSCNVKGFQHTSILLKYDNFCLISFSFYFPESISQKYIKRSFVGI